MTCIAVPADNPFSILTLAGPESRNPAWKSLMGWPRFGDTHLEYAARTASQRNLWATRLDQAVLEAGKPVLLIASGESCHAAAWWARLSPASYVSKVAGALLFAPPRSASDPATDLFASPRIPLPFPSAIVSRNTTRRALALAESWGARVLEDGWDSDETGAWHQAQATVMRLTARVVERELRVAKAFDVIV